MLRRLLVLLIPAFALTAVLVSLGVWQLQRMEWKAQQLAAIQRGIEQPAGPLPPAVDPSMRYLPVVVSGRTTGQEILVLSGTKELGGGYNVVSAFQTADGRRIMVDRGFIPQDDRHAARPPAQLTVTGNLHWPDEKGRATPEPDLKASIWFAREVPRMAEHLGTEPVLIVARAVQGEAQGIMPMPLDVSGIPNNHLSYAVQWFLFALICFGMTMALAWRIRRQTD
ncbi:SURF1 family protein [Paracoccus niistensis]|uniref:SURF1-like protein n=1 Tax=Paracoccus niistensis TaxID=632935 RepID=A0ABV6I578_9RHOB